MYKGGRSSDHDIYYCPEEDSLVLRNSSAPEDYISGVIAEKTLKAVRVSDKTKEFSCDGYFKVVNFGSTAFIIPDTSCFSEILE